MLPNDRWRSAHDVFKHQIYLDAKFLGAAVKQEVYGMFAHFFSPSGRDAYGSLNQAAKRRQTIIPDFVTSYHPYGSILQANGPQMWELKRVHSVQAFTRLLFAGCAGCSGPAGRLRRPGFTLASLSPFAHALQTDVGTLEWPRPRRTENF